MRNVIMNILQNENELDLRNYTTHGIDNHISYLKANCFSIGARSLLCRLILFTVLTKSWHIVLSDVWDRSRLPDPHNLGFFFFLFLFEFSRGRIMCLLIYCVFRFLEVG